MRFNRRTYGMVKARHPSTLWKARGDDHHPRQYEACKRVDLDSDEGRAIRERYERLNDAT